MNEYPHLLIHSHWAVSSFGNTIELYFSPNFLWDQKSRPLLFIGGVHGDEPEGVALTEATLHWLNETYQHGSENLSPWVLIPCINIDGYLRKMRVNGNGVDLNRNFPSRDWSPTFKQPRYFPGKYPSSEPETRALVHFIEQYKPRLIIHAHSWHPSITFTHNEAPNEAKILAQCSGYPLQEDIGYPTPGSLGQFAWLDHKIPVICIEEQEHMADLSQVWPHFSDAIKKIFLQK